MATRIRPRVARSISATEVQGILSPLHARPTRELSRRIVLSSRASGPPSRMTRVNSSDASERRTDRTSLFVLVLLRFLPCFAEAPRRFDPPCIDYACKSANNALSISNVL